MADITYLFGALDRSISWKQDLVYFVDGKPTNQILRLQTFNNDKEAATAFFKALMEALDGAVLRHAYQGFTSPFHSFTLKSES